MPCCIAHKHGRIVKLSLPGGGRYAEESAVGHIESRFRVGSECHSFYPLRILAVGVQHIGAVGRVGEQQPWSRAFGAGTDGTGAQHGCDLVNFGRHTQQIVGARLQCLAGHVVERGGVVGKCTPVLQPQFLGLECKPVEKCLAVDVVLLCNERHTFAAVVHHFGEQHLALRNVGFGERPQIAGGCECAHKLLRCGESEKGFARAGELRGQYGCIR